MLILQESDMNLANHAEICKYVERINIVTEISETVQNLVNQQVFKQIIQSNDRQKRSQVVSPTRSAPKNIAGNYWTKFPVKEIEKKLADKGLHF